MARTKGTKNITPKQWAEMREDYIVKNMSLREIAKERGYSEEPLFRKSSEDNWVLERTKYWANIQQELGSFLTEKVVEAKKNMINTGLYLFGKGVQAYQKAIDKIDKAQPNEKGEKPEWSLAEARTMMHDGVKIIELFMEEHKQLDITFPQVEESEAAKAVMAFFDKLHGKPTNRLTDSPSDGSEHNS